LGFPADIFIGGIFCLQFDRGEAKGLRRTTAAYTVRSLLLILSLNNFGKVIL